MFQALKDSLLAAYHNIVSDRTLKKVLAETLPTETFRFELIRKDLLTLEILGYCSFNFLVTIAREIILFSRTTVKFLFLKQVFI